MSSDTVETRLARIEERVTDIRDDVREVRLVLQALTEREREHDRRLTRVEERQSRTTGILAVAQVIGTALGVVFGLKQ